MKQRTTNIETTIQRHAYLAPLLLRIGLAAVLMYAAIASIITPNDWVGYVPAFIREFVPATTVLGALSVAQIIVAVWLLSGIYVRLAALVCAAMLAGIIVANLSLFTIIFRDIGLFFAALALAAMGNNASK